MPRNVGRRNRYITITQAPSKDGSGDFSGSWTTVRSEWAEFLAPTRRAQTESTMAGRAASPVAYSVRINYCTDLTVGMRVTYGGATYDVAQVVPDVAGREFTDLVCVAGVV